MYLPKEICREILFQCDVDTLDNCRLISKLIEEILTEDSFWKSYYDNIYENHDYVLKDIVIHRNAAIKQCLPLISEWHTIPYVFSYAIKYSEQGELVKKLSDGTIIWNGFHTSVYTASEYLRKIRKELIRKLYQIVVDRTVTRLQSHLLGAEIKPEYDESIYIWIMALEQTLTS